MLNIFGMQIRKVFARADVRISSVIFFLIPVFLAFMISVESGIIQIGDSVFSAIGYVSVIIGLLKSLFLIGVIVSLISTSLISREIDSGLDCIYFTRAKKQTYIFLSKIMSMDIFVTVLFLLLFSASVLGWAIFLKDTRFGDNMFFTGETDENLLLIFSVISAYMEIIMLSRLFALISLLFRFSRAVVINLIFLVTLKLLANIEAICGWIPSYIGDGSGLISYSGNELIRYGIRGIIILAAYALVLGILGILTYKKMDLVR